MATNGNIEIEERRRWHRSQFTVPVRVRIKKARETTLMNTHCSQMNDGGLAVYADTELPIGEEAEIEFTDYHLTVRGAVRNRAGDLYGMEFLAASNTERTQLSLLRKILHIKVCRNDL
jgi:hypothetical protein